MAETNVWFFYPNLIGYLRIILAVVSFEAMTYAPWRAAICYILSAASDAVDGYVARFYNQSSRFGAMLDMLTDRCALMALVMCCGCFYPRYLFYFQLSAVVDIASHWLHFHASDVTGKMTHKQSSNPVLHLYYTSRPFLFVMCLGNEAFYSLVYINHFWSGPGLHGFHLISFLAALFFPFALVKSMISLLHLFIAAQTLVTKDQELIKQSK
ncbi:CDP-alcohol phosphatidyltransferase [Onchocerca flexuosa]|uniref:CDP-diacylglycerol--inositol 3-phosphatidyltransferase n=1 Tax=Onchocerca flexuosa TaxID=387005 RepID=A0A238C5H0_9BILA|nr:CDP-alcohol phosphatidyltransferase [Onchocerca flexuosa]